MPYGIAALIFCMGYILIIHQVFFSKLDYADQSDHPTNRKSSKWVDMGNFYPNGLKLGMEVSFMPPRIEKFGYDPANILPTSLTNPKVAYTENFQML